MTDSFLQSTENTRKLFHFEKQDSAKCSHMYERIFDIFYYSPYTPEATYNNRIDFPLIIGTDYFPPLMLGNRYGFATCEKWSIGLPYAVVTHCILHCQALASKCYPVTLKKHTEKRFALSLKMTLLFSCFTKF